MAISKGRGIVPSKHSRMIVDVTPEIQMAIRLRAIKEGLTTGDVVAMAIRSQFPQDVDDAKKAIKDNETCAQNPR